MKTALYYFAAFAMSALVTYELPGDNIDKAFVDAMGILLSLIFLGFGVLHAVLHVQKDIR